MVLVQKWPFFQLFFQAIQARKMSFMIFQNEKTPFQAMKTKWPFFQVFFFQAIQAKKNVFYDILEQKNAVLGYKKRSSNSRKIDIFPKGLTQGFRPKMAIFPTFFFQAIQARKNVFYDILERKNIFQGYKNKKFKKSKN